MALLDAIYRRSPIPVQSTLVAVYGAAWYLRRFGRHYRRKLHELRDQEGRSESEFMELQTRAFNRLLAVARRSSYYRPLIDAAGLSGRDDVGLDELPKLPTLTKDTLRRRPRDLLTGRPPWSTRILRSSGTTGTPTDIYYTAEFHQQGLAYFQARCRDWADIGHGEERAMFGVRKVCNFDQSRPPFWRRSPLERLTYYSIYHLSPANLPHYAEALERRRPRLIMGYPSALNLVAEYLIEAGIRLNARAVVTTSETVTPDFRHRVEQAFGCRLFDQYGAVEGTHFAAQCEHGRYHVSPERGIIEILDGDAPAPRGRPGRVVVTGLENHLQPLIRYELGDVAYWAEDQQCPCGRHMPILGGIEGRYEDYCVTPDGRRILRFDTVFKGVASIVEAQVVQTAVDRFQINLVPTAAFSDADRRRLIDNFRRHAGDVNVTIVAVERIPRTASGKFRAVVNRLKYPGAGND